MIAASARASTDGTWLWLEWDGQGVAHMAHWQSGQAAPRLAQNHAFGPFWTLSIEASDGAARYFRKIPIARGFDGVRMTSAPSTL
ncbi:MAG TPA: hypothetical protein VFN09_01315 [Rhodanobacteraceae bacterium]|nr:hypothetical protein [Rhodanobacteraceae bacterium]